MPTYQVKSTIRKDGKLHLAGSSIELTEAEAAEIPWAIGAIADQAAGDEPNEGDPKPKKGKKS